MHFNRFMTRLQIAIALCASAVMPAMVHAQSASTYPTKPITLVVPAATGGTTDLAARMVSQALATSIGQSVIVDNKGGGNGNLGANLVKRAEPDGHTLLVQYSGYHVITPFISKAAMQWSNKDFEPVANVLSAPQVIVVRASLPVKNLAELIAYAKAKPGLLNYASSGNGSLQHVTGVMMEQITGIRMTHVPYKGTGPALQDLLGGQVDLTFGTPPPFIPHIQSGKLRAIAVTSKKRLPTLPDVPTTVEAGMPTLDATSWFAVFAPAKTPKPVIDKLAREIQKATDTASFRQKALDLGAEADYMNPQQLADMVQRDQVRWEKIVKAANITAD